MKKKKLGLIPRLIIAIILGILIGMYMPMMFCRVIVTASDMFSEFLKFVIPLMVVSFITVGIADLNRGAGRLLLITLLLAYGSTLIAGCGSYFVATSLFPKFMDFSLLNQISFANEFSVKPIIDIHIAPVIDTMSAVILAFIVGLCLSGMRARQEGGYLYQVAKDLAKIINIVLNSAIIPFLPLFICGTFIEMTKSGKTFAVLGVLWKVFLVVICLHLIYLLIEFVVAGLISKKNPFEMMKNQIPAYMTALGTQSSAATIPVNLECAKNNGICENVKNFVVPLCANIHMSGSMITITSCAIAVCLMSNIPFSLATILPFIMTLGVAMVASPGAPGGSIMTALPFLYLIFGVNAGSIDGPICALMVALYITQDSFGTACNVSGDNAIGSIVNTIYKKFI